MEKKKILKVMLGMFLFLIIVILSSISVNAIDLDNIQFTESTFYEGGVSNREIIELSNGNYAIGYIRSSGFYLKICELQQNNTLSCGAEQSIVSTTQRRDLDLIEDTVNNKIIYIAGRTFGNAIQLNLDGSKTGLSISFESGETDSVSVVILDDTYFMIAYSDVSSSGDGRTIRCRLVDFVCDSSINFDSYNGISSIKAVRTTSDEVLIAYRYGSNNYGALARMSLSNTLIQNRIYFNTGLTSQIDMIEGSDNKLKIVYKDESSSNYGKFTSCELNGQNCISEVTFNNGVTNYNRINELNNKLFISFRDDSNSDSGTSVNMDLDGLSLSEESIFSDDVTLLSQIINSDNKLMISYTYQATGDGMVAVSQELKAIGGTQQTYVQVQPTSITTSSTSWTTLMDGNFTISGSDAFNQINSVDTESPVYSPDGKYIVYVNRNDTDRLYRKNASDTGNGIQITTDAADDPIFTENGSYIVFANYYENDYLYKKNASDTSNGIQINSVPSESPTISPDNNSIVYVNKNDLDRLYRKNYNDTGNGVIITTAQAESPVYSPDGNSIIYVNQNDGNRLYLKPANDDLNNGYRITDTQVLDPVFSPDGQYIVYTNFNDVGKLYRKLASDTSDGFPITDIPVTAPSYYPAYDPNQQFIVFSNFNNNGYLTQLNLSSGGNTYREVILHIGDSSQDVPIKCRTVLDGFPTVEPFEVTAEAGKIFTLNIMNKVRPIQTGEHNVKVECQNQIPQEVTYAVGVEVGHILKTSTDEVLNYYSDNTTTIINSGESYSSIKEVEFQPSNLDNENKYILLDWNNYFTNNLNQPQTIKFKPSITNLLETINCEEQEIYVKAGETKTLGGLCYVKVQNNENQIFKIESTGVNVENDMLFNIKELNYASETDISKFVAIPYTTNTVTLEEIANTTLTTTLENAEVVIKGTLTATSQTEDQYIGEARIYDEFDNFLYATQTVGISTDGNPEALAYHAAIPIPTGTVKVKLFGRTLNGSDVNVLHSEFTTYITQKLDLTDNFFQIEAFEFWDNTQLSNFSAIVGNTTYETTGNTINAIGINTFQNIRINKQDYISRLYENYPTGNNLDAKIGQYEANIELKERYTNISINNFTIHTSIGNFSTNTGLLKLYPFQDIYYWNISANNYFNKTDVLFQIGEIVNNFNINNIIDTEINFVDENSNPIFPNCDWLGNDLINDYNITAQNKQDELLTCRLGGYQSFQNSFTSGFPSSYEIELGFTEINVNLYSRSTGQLINQLVNVNIDGLVKGNTTNGTLNFKNTSFLSGDYSISAQSIDYFTTQKEFTYSNENSVTIDLYLLETNLSNSYSLYAEIYDLLNYKQSGANVKLEEFDTTTQSFKEVSQCTSDSNGECIFLIEVGTKKYRVVATKEINGIIYRDVTSELGEIFQPDISQGQIVTTSQIVRNLYLKPQTEDEVPNLYGLTIIAPMQNETITFQNESETIINIPVEFNGENNLNYEVCLNFYIIQDSQKVVIDDTNCKTGSSGKLTGKNYILNRDFNYQAEITVKYNGETTIYKTYRYLSNDSLFYILSKSNYVSVFVLLVWILLLGLSLQVSNISIFGYGSIIISIMQFIFFPNFINLYLNIYIILMGITILYISRREEDQI